MIGAAIQPIIGIHIRQPVAPNPAKKLAQKPGFITLREPHRGQGIQSTFSVVALLAKSLNSIDTCDSLVIAFQRLTGFGFLTPCSVQTAMGSCASIGVEAFVTSI